MATYLSNPEDTLGILGTSSSWYHKMAAMGTDSYHKIYENYKQNVLLRIGATSRHKGGITWHLLKHHLFNDSKEKPEAIFLGRRK